MTAVLLLALVPSGHVSWGLEPARIDWTCNAPAPKPPAPAPVPPAPPSPAQPVYYRYVPPPAYYAPPVYYQPAPFYSPPFSLPPVLQGVRCGPGG